MLLKLVSFKSHYFKYCYPLILTCRSAAYSVIPNIKQTTELKLTNLRQQLVDAFDDKNTFDWKQFCGRVIENKLASKENVEVMLMNAMQMNVDIDTKVIESFIKFISKDASHIKTHKVIASRYCVFLSHFVEYLDDQSVSDVRLITEQVMEKHRNKTIIFPLVRDCLVSLSKTSKDNCLYALKLLDEVEVIKNYNEPVNEMLSSAFKYGLGQEALLLAKSTLNINLDSNNLLGFVNMLKTQSELQKVIDIFEYFKDNFIVLKSNDIDTIKETLQRFGFSYSKADITEEGLCLKCNKLLTRVSDDEFQVLKNELRATVFDKKTNLMLASLPKFEEELNYFDEFLKKNTLRDPFDLIIDGLNIGFTISGRFVPNPKMTEQKLVRIKPYFEVDQHLTETIIKNNTFDWFKNVLLIGRQHMANWPCLKKLLKQNQGQLKHFFTMNRTSDDTYILYAALQHPKTMVLANDFYRDYQEKMKNRNLENLFKRWLKSHQIRLGGGHFFIHPQQYDARFNLSEQIIHIPFSLGDDTDEELNWLCCKRVYK